MRKHNGMRPQDIVVLLKILVIDKENWQFKDLAGELEISPAEISESLNRSYLAGLLDLTKRKVVRQSLMEFLQHGLHYVFPQAPGAMVNGMPTAHAHSYFQKKISGEFKYVWPDPSARDKGLTIEPLYPGAVQAAKKDDRLYILLASLDIIRVGRTREYAMALQVLQQNILHAVQ